MARIDKLVSNLERFDHFARTAKRRIKRSLDSAHDDIWEAESLYGHIFKRLRGLDYTVRSGMDHDVKDSEKEYLKSIEKELKKGGLNECLEALKDLDIRAAQLAKASRKLKKAVGESHSTGINVQKMEKNLRVLVFRRIKEMSHRK